MATRGRRSMRTFVEFAEESADHFVCGWWWRICWFLPVLMWFVAQLIQVKGCVLKEWANLWVGYPPD